ncbi:MAG: regulatory protein RecX, partial [Acidobacteriota bacterium]
MSETRLSAYDQAVKLLAQRAHLRREVEQKLLRRGYPGDEIEAALGRLAEQGYLDDARVAADYAAGRAARGGEGARRLRSELLRRGADPETANAAVSAAVPDDDRELALEAARGWLARGGHDPAALARHLDRKGFTRRAIHAALRE